MKDDLRKVTRLIIEKDKQYLVGTILYSTDLRWSLYKSDAWWTRDIEKARLVQQAVGGRIMLFNPIVNQISEYKGARA